MNMSRDSFLEGQKISQGFNEGKRQDENAE